MPRLFTGIELPAALTAELAGLRTPLAGARWIEPEDMHLTLRFVGDVDNSAARELHAALTAIDEPAFEMRLMGLGAFGGHQPRTLWVGVEPCPALEMLARANDRAARVAGLPPDKHGFKAHVTLARLRTTRPDEVARVLSCYAAFRSASFAVERFALFSSRPRIGGGPYVIEDVFPLSGGAYDAASEWLGER